MIDWSNAMNKSAKTYRLSEASLTYLDTYAKENHLSNTAALERILCEHKEFCEEQGNQIAAQVVKLIDEKYSNMFTRVRLASTMADRNLEVVLEILNTFLITYKVDRAFTSEMAKSGVWEECDTTVKNRIAKYKQRKDNKK